LEGKTGGFQGRNRGILGKERRDFIQEIGRSQGENCIFQGEVGYQTEKRRNFR
jgi:hypothetical protein